jgi:uncharacterized protein YbjT (DUF2867 family)
MNKTVLITGATGMVGSLVLKNALASEHISKVIVYGRSSVDFEHDKMKEFLSPVFTQFPVSMLKELPSIDHVLFCVGVYTGAVKRDVFRQITVDYPVELAKKHLLANPNGCFSLLSGQGADRSEESRMMFAKDKGQAENILSGLYNGSFFTFRPGYIYPVESRTEPNFSYRISRLLYPLLKNLGPKFSITSHQLAKGILKSVTLLPTKEILENHEILNYLKQ